MVDALRVVFFGTPQFAVPTLDALMASPHRVVGIVTQPDRARGRGQRVSDAPVKAAARAHGLDVQQPERLKTDEAHDALRTWRPDLGVVAAYGKLIPPSMLTIPRLGMINVHASLLPKYRGAAPVHRAVIDGEHETGVTIMRVAAKLDAGAMFARVIVPIDPDATSDEVERELATRGAALLVDVVDAIAAGRAREEPQDEGLATYAAKLTKEEGLVDWTLSARTIHDRVRGLYPWPHAYTYLDGARVILRRTALVDSGHASAPGTVVDVTRDAMIVATGHSGALALLELQPEGRRPMSAREFLLGRPIRPGARLTAP